MWLNGIRTLADLRDVESPPWIWDGFLLPSGITLLSAAPKVGKTTFISHLLRALWTEDSFIGQDIRPAPVLVVSEEADTLIAQRCDIMGYSEMWPIGWLTPEPGRTWEQTLAYIKWYAHHYHHPIIVVDTLSRHWGIDDENDNAKIEAAMNPLIGLARSTGISLLLSHHMRKSGGFGGTASRGGSAIVGAVDIIIELGRTERGDRSNRRHMEMYSRYGETPESLTIALTDDGYVLDQGTDAGIGLGRSEYSVHAWLQANPGWWTADSIGAVLGMPTRTVREALGALTVTDTIYVKGTGRKGSPYTYSATEDSDEQD